MPSPLIHSIPTLVASSAKFVSWLPGPAGDVAVDIAWCQGDVLCCQETRSGIVLLYQTTKKNPEAKSCRQARQSDVHSNDAAAAAGVRAWPGRAHGAGGCCGGAFCVHRWYSVCGRCGRGERAARGLLRACTGGRCGRVVRSAAAAERSACVAGTACARAENLGWGTLVDAAETLG